MFGAINNHQLSVFVFAAKPVIQFQQNKSKRRCCKSFVVGFKKSDFQDFQGYAKPSHLLPTTEVKEYNNSILLQDDTLASSRWTRSQCFYKIKLRTSNLYGSSLSNMSASILLCLIDKNGDSILQSIHAAASTTEFPRESNEIGDLEVLRFQRGCVDEFIFTGPSLENFEALWISAESGQWRLGGVTLFVIPLSQSLSGKADMEESKYGIQYDFDVEDVLLGEGSDTSMIELRPCLITELAGVDTYTLLSKGTSPSTPSLDYQISNEESMKEYSNLKFSLLLYDVMLVSFGSAVAYFSFGENAALAFFIGGVGGFMYLLLLQRSVDKLPSSALTSRNPDGMFGGLNAPISSLALALGFATVAVKYGLGDGAAVFTPKDLVVGMLGFLACKAAVVLAAFRPLEFTPGDES